MTCQETLMNDPWASHSLSPHRNEDVYDNTEKGWRQQIFLRIRQIFGYGLGL